MSALQTEFTCEYTAALADAQAAEVAHEPSPKHAPKPAAGALAAPSVDAVISAVRAALAERGIPVFAHFDHAANAAAAGLALPPTQVLVFGAPAVGTLLMQAFPSMALELPLRMACWQTADGTVKLAVPDMAAIAARHGAQDHPVIAKMQQLLTALAQSAGGR